MTTQQLLTQLQSGQATFSTVMAYIDARYQYQATAFQNGQHYNTATENQGSAKVLFFAQTKGLDPQQTLMLFAEHYAAVLATPDGDDHRNIRQFMRSGWEGIQFEGCVLSAK